MLTIAFDLDDTLYSLEAPYLRMLALCFPDADDLPGRALFCRQLDRFEDCFKRVQAGQASKENLFADRQVLAFQDFGIPLSHQKSLEVQATYRACQREISLSDEVRGMLDRLVAAREAGRVRFGILSNGQTSNQWRKLKILGLESWVPAHQIVVSEEVGYAKPDPRIFQVALDRLGATPADVAAGDCWYVGDSVKNDVAGASNAGWRCLWVDHGYGLPGSDQIHPDLRVTDEHQMTEAVLGLLG